jgi:hypothetical protein
MLRLEAQAFGTAEYDEPVAGRGQPLLRRLAWYLLGVLGILALVTVHPKGELDLFLTVGDRSGLVIAIALAIGGVALAVAVAWWHYRRLRLPDVGSYPGALSNEILTAFIDEATFRGAVMGYFLWAGADTGLAILGQTVVYALATRLGAPGRDRYMFVLALLVGLVGGAATIATNGIGASFLGHAITRVAVFLTTGHAGQPAARGAEVEDVERRRRTPDGWRSVERSAARDR